MKVCIRYGTVYRYRLSLSEESNLVRTRTDDFYLFAFPIIRENYHVPVRRYISQHGKDRLFGTCSLIRQDVEDVTDAPINSSEHAGSMCVRTQDVEVARIIANGKR
jgi:hypothetical protein